MGRGCVSTAAIEAGALTSTSPEGRQDATPPRLPRVTDAINERLPGENGFGAERAFKVMGFKTYALVFAQEIQ